MAAMQQEVKDMREEFREKQDRPIGKMLDSDWEGWDVKKKQTLLDDHLVIKN